MGIDRYGDLSPSASGILEITNQLLLLGIHADNRSSGRQKQLPDTADEAKLLIAVRVAWRQALAIAEQAVFQALQQTTHRRGANLKATLD